jgi:triosephosphate isomerase
VDRVPCIAGNWKMNKNITEALQLVEEMLPRLSELSGVERVVCPPFIALPAVAERLKDEDVFVGSQNVHWKEAGAFTGEISPTMLQDLCTFAIIGHSERRAYFGETNETVNLRVRAALNHGLRPIVCVGETLEQREAGQTIDVVSTQVSQGFADISKEDFCRVIVAYEPIWAIGTGKAATPEDANETIVASIRPVLTSMFGEDIAQATRIQYGGSVKPGNATEFFRQPNIDGALVGGASLRADDFIAIVKAARG